MDPDHTHIREKKEKGAEKQIEQDVELEGEAFLPANATLEASCGQTQGRMEAGDGRPPCSRRSPEGEDGG